MVARAQEVWDHFQFLGFSLSYLDMTSLIKSLLWRSALKSFVPIAPELVNVKPILEAIQWSPSAFGVQPYNVHVVSDPKLKEELYPVSYNQAQVMN